VRLIIIVASTVGICFLAILIYLSGESTKQSVHDHERKEVVRQFDEEQRREAAEEEARREAWRREHPAPQPEAPKPDPFDEETEVANLKSSDREVLNQAIQRLQFHKVCRVMPELLEIMKTSSDDYIAGIAAGAIVDCKQPETYQAVVDEFLQRPAEPTLIRAVGETGSQDDRVYAKLHKLITEPNPDPLVAHFARHAKWQIDLKTQTGGR
jgi:hypothetical protein